MRIQLLSDTHHHPYWLNPEADLIVHAGDFGNGLRALTEFQAACEALGKPFVCVLGNHDFYHENIHEVYRHIEQQRLPCLYENQVFEWGGWRFVGGTLFSNFRQHRYSSAEHARHMHEAQHCLPDFAYIYEYEADGKTERRVCPQDYLRYYRQQLAWIERFRHQPKVVVLTHFPPSLVCLDPHYADSPFNPYFINDIDLTGFDYWLAGHTHRALDVDHQDCRVVINPLGYVHEHGKNGFREQLLIELG